MIREFRLLIAEWLLSKAQDACPKDGPEFIAMTKAIITYHKEINPDLVDEIMKNRQP